MKTYCPAVERLLRRALQGAHYTTLRQRIRQTVTTGQPPSTITKSWGTRLTVYEEEVLIALDAAFVADNRVH